MWYFSWILGVGFAVLLGILNALWFEHAADRKGALDTDETEQTPW